MIRSTVTDFYEINVRNLHFLTISTCQCFHFTWKLRSVFENVWPLTSI